MGLHDFIHEVQKLSSPTSRVVSGQHLSGYDVESRK